MDQKHVSKDKYSFFSDVSHAFDLASDSITEEVEIGAISADDNPTVTILDHLHVTDVVCSHLSFGSFDIGSHPMISGSFPPKLLRSNLEMAPVTIDSPLDELNVETMRYRDLSQGFSSQEPIHSVPDQKC